MKMKISILGNWEGNYKYLEEMMESVIEEYGLFTVVCGGNSETEIKDSIGYKWSEKYGAPVEFLNMNGESDIDKMIWRLVRSIDYAVIAYDGSGLLRKIIMKMKSEGKKGNVLRVG